MRKESQKIDTSQIEYDISEIDSKENILFFDIETTGLSSHNSYIYMIGMAHYIDNNWFFTGLMAENASEELELLSEFAGLLNNYKTLIHFNGNRFDIPFIKDRCHANGLSIEFDRLQNIDIYKRISTYRHILGIANCKQKTLESYIGLNRLDEYSGGELIAVYKSYVDNPSEDTYKLLYQHNHDDVEGMLHILPILNIEFIFRTLPTVKNVSTNIYSDFEGNEKQELLIEFELQEAIPGRIFTNSNGCYLSICQKSGLLKTPVFSEEMKLFYQNYKDYYYLPEEDMAIHKSVGSFVDRSFREPAKARNCYTKLFSHFIPQWDEIVSPYFKRNYEDKEMYFELNKKVITDYTLFSKYTAHILKLMKK